MADGSDINVSGDRETGSLYDYAWSPDSGSLVFSVGEEYETGSVDMYVRAALFTVNSDGTNLTQITSAEADNRFAAWSTSGQLVFYSDRDGSGDLYTMDPDGSNVVQLTHGPGKADNWRPVWFPDGSRVLYERNVGGRQTLISIASDGSDKRILDRLGMPGATWQLSPQGNEVAFTRYDSDTNRYQLFVTDAATDAGPVRITNGRGDVYGPDWSPDGAWIVFSRIVPGRRSDLFVASRDGSEIHRITRTHHSESGPDWRPVPTS
jgi:TolB protein